MWQTGGFAIHAAINYEGFLEKLRRIIGAAGSNCNKPILMREIYIVIPVMQMKLIPTLTSAQSQH